MQEQTEINYAEMSDNELTALFRNQNEEAFKEITKRYHYRLYETAMAMLFSSSKAHDAVNNVLQNARHTIHEYHDESLFLTWICRKLIKYVLANYELPPTSSSSQDTPSQLE